MKHIILAVSYRAELLEDEMKEQEEKVSAREGATWMSREWVWLVREGVRGEGGRSWVGIVREEREAVSNGWEKGWGGSDLNKCVNTCGERESGSGFSLGRQTLFAAYNGTV